MYASPPADERKRLADKWHQKLGQASNRREREAVYIVMHRLSNKGNREIFEMVRKGEQYNAPKARKWIYDRLRLAKEFAEKNGLDFPSFILKKVTLL